MRLLDDVFAEIGLDHLEATGLQRLVERGLLADHRLALDHSCGTGGATDVRDDPIQLGAGCGVMDLTATGTQHGLELGEVVIEIL
jgi:hypothetical protein